MNSITNTVILSGFLTKTVRVNEHEGTPVANFTLVTNSPGGKGKKDIAQFHDCTLWGKLVDSIADRLEGSPYVQVMGELRYKPVKDGNITNKNPYINVREIYIPSVNRTASSEEE